MLGALGIPLTPFSSLRNGRSTSGRIALTSFGSTRAAARTGRVGLVATEAVDVVRCLAAAWAGPKRRLVLTSLFVADHGFGGIFDLNVLAVGAALEELNLDRPVSFLTHQLAWTLGVGPLVDGGIWRLPC